MIGLVVLPRIRDYWSRNSYLKNEKLSSVFTRNRFQFILSALRINNDPARRKDKLKKIRPIIDFLKRKFREKCTVSNNLSIDESMIKFKGRSSMKQYLPNKPIKRGFKVWVMADSNFGYVFDFNIYTGKSKDKKETCLDEQVVLNFAQTLEHSFHKLFFDNYFMSISLLKKLSEINQYGCGTIQKNRKNLPRDLRSDRNLKRGEMDSRFSTNFCIKKWKDKRSVLIASNYLAGEDKEIARRESDGRKIFIVQPAEINEYNKYMGGVDHHDQMLALYNRDRKAYKYWHRIFFYLIKMTVTNAYFLSIMHGSKLSYREFLFSVSESLIESGTESSKRRSERLKNK
ncbi:unnamed protein product [Brachionus calyciflorus]|uniref:PiggyBac transposable element-derived protein domain-containing protein n=1 Tax=Brachionus calyciflorus TaxID=104777 RepID=A0A814DFM6_9BILA|nr:unnamed protein product [Brachionus calyciflorus]